MSENVEVKKPVDYERAGWGCLGLLLIVAWLISMVLQFFGSQWFWPWLFFGGVVYVIMTSEKRGKAREARK